MTTLLVTPGELAGDELWVDGGRHRHLFRARRLRTGDRLRLVDGAGGARRARVERLDRGRALLRLGALEELPGPRRQVTLLVAPPRPPRAAWLVEKATELGVAAIRFLGGERAPRRFGQGTLERLRRVAAAAVEQSGQARLPELSGVHEWSELEALLGSGGERLRLERGGGGWLTDPVSGPLSVVIGPEGGWSAAESAALEDLGCRAVGLGPAVLRVETAAVAAAALALAGVAETV